MTLPAGTKLGSWRILEPLGKGGMGEVYRAQDEGLGRFVALKVVLPERAADARFMARFAREAKAAAAIAHPHVAAVYHVGQDRGLAFLVMELLPGGTLKDRLRREGALPWPEVAELGAQVADALAAVHAAGLVHRDLKPENVLLDSEGRAKLTDFGIVGRVDSSTALSQAGLTKTGELMGTLEYMAPEQSERADVDARADLYALGATLHALLTGRPPFEGAGYALITKHLREAPPPVRTLAPDVPAELERLVLRLLEKDPAKRGNAASVRDDLRAIAARDVATSGGAPAWLPVLVLVALLVLGGGIVVALGRTKPSSTVVVAPPPAPPPPSGPKVPPIAPPEVAPSAPTLHGTTWTLRGKGHAVASSGKRIAACEFGPTTDVFVPGKREPIATFSATGTEHTTGVAISSDGQLVATSHYDFVALWSVETGARIWTSDNPQGLQAWGVAFCRDAFGAEHVAVAYYHRHDDGRTPARIALLETVGKTADPKWSFDGEGYARVRPLDDRRLLASFGGELHVRSIDTGEVLATIPQDPRLQAFAALDADRVVHVVRSSDESATLATWSVSRGADVAGSQLVVPKLQSVNALGPTSFVTGHKDGAVRVWELGSAKPRREWTKHEKLVTGACAIEGTKLIATTSYDGTLRLWDLEQE